MGRNMHFFSQHFFFFFPFRKEQSSGVSTGFLHFFELKTGLSMQEECATSHFFTQVATSELALRQSSMKVISHWGGGTTTSIRAFSMLPGVSGPSSPSLSSWHFVQQTSAAHFLGFLSLASWRPPRPGSASTAVARKRTE